MRLQVREHCGNANCSCRYESLSQPQLKARYPTLKLDADKRGVLDHSAGVLRADQCLLAYQVGVVCAADARPMGRRR